MAKPTKSERSIIDLAIKRLDKCIKADDHNRKACIEDLKFANGDQWDSGEKKRRSDKGRPALQFNLLPKFVDQVVGDMMHNQPSIKIHAGDAKSDPNIAKIRQGIIANIEYNSNSKAIYTYASKQMVTCGYGAWRVLTRYADENPFLQEAYLEAIRNPFLVYMDPTAKDQNYADAKYGFILEKMSKDDFESRYPKATYPSDSMRTGVGLDSEHWFDGEKITVAEYFTVEKEPVEMLQLTDGRVVTKEKFEEIQEEWDAANELINRKMMTQVLQPQQPQTAQLPMSQGAASMQPPQITQPPVNPNIQALQSLGEPPKVAKRRTEDQIVIRHRIITAFEILDGGAEGNIFPGKFIPIVLLKGKEINIEGKNYVYGLVRHAKDTQKMYNYWNTAAAETIALAPKSPWIGTPKQFEGFERDYAAANVENMPFLQYNADPEAPGPPQRTAPPQPPVAIFQMIAKGEETLKSVIGMFNADVGASGSEQTGAAIIARQRPGDIGTYEFTENRDRAVTYTGKILNSIIPHIYDSERDVRLRNVDNTETFMPINTTVGSAAKAIKNNPEMFNGVDLEKIKQLLMTDGKDAKFNDITVGKYDVVVTTGPSYATQRQESAQHLLQLTQAMPQQMALAADLIVQNLDFKDADEMANRLRKTLPPGMTKPKAGDQPPPPPPPPPQVILAQAKLQGEQSKQQLQMMKVEQEKVRLEHEKVKMQLELAKLEQEKLQLAQQRNESIPKVKPSDEVEVMRIQLEKERLATEKAKLDQEREMEMMRAQMEKMKLEMELHKQNLSTQHARELHSMKLQELEAEVERKERLESKEHKNKKDPLRLRR